MNPNEIPSGDLPVTDWRILGQLELTIGSNIEQQIRTWLMELLLPLQLHESFVNKLFASAHEYSLRALHCTAGPGRGHIHLAMLVQQPHASHGQTWGFFRIEKIDTTEEAASHPDHWVEFYLYGDGQ